MTRGSIALLVVLLVAAGLRLWRLDFDLPEVRYVDAAALVAVMRAVTRARCAP